MSIQQHAYARAGLVGNPSDGYNGKTISIIVRNFSATVTLEPWDDIEIVPSDDDLLVYPSVQDLVVRVREHGYHGGAPLMKAAIRRFADYCELSGLSIPPMGFRLTYDSDIPRRVGMAGSSALITACMRCLMKFYDVEIPKTSLPNIVMAVETEELGISAGLQDRVIQTYEGCVYMDFDKTLMDTQGHGYYEPIDPKLLPKIYIAYRDGLGEGSEVFHNDVRARWLRGDPEVIQAMKDFAGYAQEAYDLIKGGRGKEIGPILDRNFDRRKSIFKLDPNHVALVERARSVGASAKYSGSGGAIVGTYEDDAMYAKLEAAMAEIGAQVIKPVIA